MHGGGGGLAGGAGVRVSRLQVLTQRAVHGPETRTLHVVKKKSIDFSIGAMSMTILHTLVLKPSQSRRQIWRQTSCGSAAIAGGPMDNRTITMLVATIAILSTAVAMVIKLNRLAAVGCELLEEDTHTRSLQFR